MKTINILLVFSLFQLLIFPQQKAVNYTDISPDGKLLSIYESDQSSLNGHVEKLSDDIPFGLTPDWSSTLERQIGGMAWADYDNDGDLDLATGCYFSNSFPPIPDYEVLIYRNDNGELTTAPAWVSSDMRSTTDLRFADLDRDGKPELLAANGDQSFAPSVIYFNGNGGLNNTPGWISTDNNWTVGAAFADIDGDGDLDLAFGNQGNTVDPTKPICVFYNNNGNFPTSPGWISADEMITNSVAFGDLNNQQLINEVSEFSGDGNRHAFLLPLFPIYSVDSVTIEGQLYPQYCIDPIGGWISLGTKPASGTQIRIYYKYVSRGDLAASKWVNYESGVYYNNNGVLNNLPGWTVGNTQSQKGIAWADFDKDGFQDLAISGSSVQTVVYKNDNGTLTGPVWTSNTVNPSAQELITGDLDRDGYPELAVVHFGTKRIEIFKNRNGLLDTEPTWLYIAGSSATSISLGDLNGDGALDLAVGTARSPVVVFINQSPPIPVELNSFTASVNEHRVELKWITYTERNNRGFEIERKETDKNNWMTLGYIEGRGTITEPTIYSYVDYTLNHGTYNYRIKQIDFNGSFTYYNLSEQVDFGAPVNFELAQNYPNPFNPGTTISYSIPQTSNVTVKVFDILGNEVSTLVNEIKEAGRYNINFNAAGLSSGVYFYSINSGSFSRVKKMIMIK